MPQLLHAFLSQTAQSGEPSGPAGIFGSPLVMILLMFGVFYLVVFRPQAKQRKKHEEMVGKLQKGNDVMTQAGIYGTVVSVEKGVVTLDVGKGTQLRVAQAYIGRDITQEEIERAAKGAKK